MERLDSGCLANIDATIKPLTVTLDHTAFRIMLQDHHGQDRNLVPDINVTISSPPQFGQFNNKVTGERDVNKFKVMDLEEDTIEYHFVNQNITTYSDNFSWTFQYGNSAVSLQLQICVRPIPIPQVVHMSFASVAFGGMVNLDSTHLAATNSRGGVNDSLVYHIISPPRNGSIFDKRAEIMNTNLTNFTQTYLNQQRVVYQNRYSDMSSNMQDSFTFQVCTEYACTDPIEFVIRVYLVNLTIINTGFSVKEGAKHYITTQELNIFAPANSENLRFFITPPNHGNITLETFNSIVGVPYFDLEDLVTQHIFYQNDDSEHLHDSFEITATADYFNETSRRYERLPPFTDIVNITIRPVNDNPPEFVHQASEFDAVVDGSTVITRMLLSAHDYDSDMRDEDIVWRLQYRSPYRGYMYLDEDLGEMHAITSWTEGDLRAGRLYYRNNKDASEDIIVYEITDGHHVSEVEDTSVKLTPIIFESKATARDPLRVTEGENVSITTDYLSYCASNDRSLGDEDFIYTLRSLPLYGSLMFNGDTLRNESSFNQRDLRDDSLIYIHDHSNSQSDTFQYSLSVPNRPNRIDTEPYEFEILIDSVDDDPPVVTFIQDPLFVVELSRVLVNGSALVIEDLDSQNDVEFDEIVCTIQRAPRYGLLQRQRHGKFYLSTDEFTKYDVFWNQLWYNHTSLGHYEDSFTFMITDGINPQSETYEVRIVILPSTVSIQVHNISVDEGRLVHLEREYFTISHAYLSTAPGRFIITRPPSNGILSNDVTNMNEIGEFTTRDLTNNYIVYHHNDEESVSDSFEFLYESLEPEGLQRWSDVKTVYVHIDPVDDQPPIFSRQRISMLDIISGQEVVLDEQYLNVSDGDTPPTHLNYTFTLNIRGHIAFSNDTKRSIRWFTYADVMAGRVIFVHKMDLNGNIEFNVTDGKQDAFAILKVSTRTLEIICNQDSWSNISVVAEGEVQLGESHLMCRIYDIDKRQITFTVSKPIHGRIKVGGEVRNNFTMDEITHNMVSYVHNDFEFWEDKERLNASATSDFVAPFIFQLVIHIQYPHSNTSALAVNEGLVLNEGDSACLNVSSLDARNLRYRAWRGIQGDEHVPSSPGDLVPVFNLTRLPEHGQLLLNGTDITELPASFNHSDVAQGTVCYQHSGSETVEDSIHFQLYFTKNNSTTPLKYPGSQAFLNRVEESIVIRITPVNDERPHLITRKNLTLVLGFIINITVDHINVTDKDSPASNITFELLVAPQNANLYWNDVILQRNSYFTQADINSNKLKMKPLSRTMKPDHFTLSFGDEALVPTEANVTIYFTVSEHNLKLVSGNEVTYQQNEKEAIITTEHLNTTTNGNRKDTVFVVESDPLYGRLLVVSGASRPAHRFSQTDIDERKVKYIPTNINAHEDRLTLRVENKEERLNVNITFSSLAWGSVKEDAIINFTSSLSQPLPPDLLKLEVPGKPPEIQVVEKPHYGKLGFFFQGAEQESDMFSFHYDDLNRSWIVYTWNYTEPITNDTLVDHFTMLVLATGMQPGKAAVSLKIYPPKSYGLSSTTPLPNSATRSTQPAPSQQSSSDSGSDQGFPLFTLVPILGTFSILLVMIVVIILFCTTQQKRIRRKWQPGVARPSGQQRTYPWSVSSHTPRAVVPPNYNFDPTSQSGESDNEEHNSETSSGFSEPVMSPRHSPTQAFPLPAHSQQSPLPGSNRPPYGSPSLVPSCVPRSRARSNVSITFSSRQSMASDVSIEDSTHFYSHSLPRPQQQGVVNPIPMRPASHSAFTRVQRPVQLESGYNSGMFRNAEDSGVPSRAGSCGDYEDESELPHFPSADVDLPLALDDRLSGAMLPSLSCPSDAGPGPMELKSSSAIGEEFLDLSDPNILQLLRSPKNPVLRKEEYWV